MPELGIAPPEYVSEFVYTISGENLADSKYSDEICYEVAHWAEYVNDLKA